MLRVSILVSVLLAAPLASSYHEEVARDLAGPLLNPLAKNNNVSPRLIGGTVVTPHAYPFQTGLLIYKDSDIYFCGGTLITNQWILTAAHCVDMKPDYILTVLGAHNLTDLDTNVQVYNTSKYKRHESWNSDTLINDVGLIRLPENATINTYVKVVPLANGNNTYVNQDSITLGWGETETEALSYVLKQVTSKVISNDDCANAHEIFKDTVKKTNICSSGAGIKGGCSGDSGGPLLVNNTQVGIVSFGANVCNLGLPSVYTRVTDYYDWIWAHTNDDSGANIHSVGFAAVITAALCVVRLFKLM